MATQPKSRLWRVLIILAAAGLVVFIILQLLPIGSRPTNPPVLAEPNWNSPQTRELAKRAGCACHSNETVWPWYSYIAPVSWLVTGDADKGRKELNFSEWGITRAGRGGPDKAEEAAELIMEGKMPLPIFLPLHPEANLSAAEKQLLIDGLAATLK